jgi:hypothetical protein
LGGIVMEEKEELNDQIVKNIMWKVLLKEKKFVRQNIQNHSEIIKEHMKTVKEFANVNTEH